MRQTVVFIILVFVLCSCSEKSSYPEAPVSGDVIKLKTAALKEAEEAGPLFLSYLHNGKRIVFFVLKTNGNVQSYFDACAKCSPFKLGYRFSKGELLCRACGMRYPVESLRGIGSCYPIVLEGRVEGDNYIIEKAKVIAGERYF